MAVKWTANRNGWNCARRKRDRKRGRRDEWHESKFTRKWFSFLLFYWMLFQTQFVQEKCVRVTRARIVELRHGTGASGEWGGWCVHGYKWHVKEWMEGASGDGDRTTRDNRLQCVVQGYTDLQWLKSTKGRVKARRTGVQGRTEGRVASCK